MKRLLANILMMVVGLTAASQLMALGLGELTLKSALNQPLQAEIELVDANGLSEWEIKPALASQADFDRAGVDRVFFLTSVTFKVDGNRILLTTREPVNEPFLNFLVELNWPAGRVLREYTVLLDPPVFQEENSQPLVTTPQVEESPAQSEVPDQSEVAGQSEPQAAVASDSDVTVKTPSEPVAVNRWDAEPAPAGSYKVQQNDTLWDIALQTRPSASISPQQMMIALQQENPGAFIGGNINRLKSHQVLRIPDEARVRSVGASQAIAEVARQNQSLRTGVAQVDATGRGGDKVAARAGKQGGEVRLLSAGSDEAKSAGAAGEVSGGSGAARQQSMENDLAVALENVDKGRRENEELRKRLESLEDQINTLQRLVALKNDQLAGMQVSPAPGDESAGATPATAAAEGEVAKSDVDFNYDQKSSGEADGAAPDASVKSEAAPEEDAKARRERIAAMLAEKAKEEVPQPSLLDGLMANPLIPAGVVLLLLVAGLFGFRAIKKRKDAARAASEDQSAQSLASLDDMNVDSSSLDDFDFDDDELRSPVSAKSDQNEKSVHDDHFETVAQTEDAISESDIYIAYGKFEQAVDLLQSAIEREPSRTDLRLKLLEVYVEMDDPKGFAFAESELASLGDRAAIAEAKQMRQRLSSPVPSALSGAGSLQSSSASLSLDDEIPELDSALGDEFADGLDFGDALDMADEPATIVKSKAPVESRGASLDDVPVLDLDDGLDFDIGGDDFPVTQKETVKDSARSADADDALEFDLGDFDEPAVPAVEEKPAKTAVADDLLEFDLDSFGDEPVQITSAPDSLDSSDDGLAFDLDDAGASSEADSMESLESLLDGDSAGADELPDLSFEMDQDTGFSAGENDDLRALEDDLNTSAEMDDLDADLAALSAGDDASLSANSGVKSGSFASDSSFRSSDNPDQDAGEIDLDQLAAADDEFDFLAGTDECATKLDLARAYIDMEDFDGARELLQEVMQEGSDQQKSDARSLLSNLA